MYEKGEINAMSVRLLRWVSSCAVAATVAVSAAACGSSGGPAPAGLAGSPAPSPSGTSSAGAAASKPITAPAPGGGSNTTFCLDFVKALGQDSSGNTPPLTPGEVALVDRTDAEAPAAVKSAMDAIDASIHQEAKGNYAGVDPAAGQDYESVLTWISAGNCSGALSTAP